MHKLAANTENRSFGVKRKLDVPILVTLLCGREEMLATILDPFYRALQQKCTRGDGDLLG